MHEKQHITRAPVRSARLLFTKKAHTMSTSVRLRLTRHKVGKIEGATFKVFVLFIDPRVDDVLHIYTRPITSDMQHLSNVFVEHHPRQIQEPIDLPSRGHVAIVFSKVPLSL